MKVTIMGTRFVDGRNRDTGEVYSYVDLHCCCNSYDTSFNGQEVFNCRIYPKSICFDRARNLKPGSVIDAEIVINNYRKGIVNFA